MSGAFRKFVLAQIPKLSKRIAKSLLMQIQLLNAQLLNLGEYEQLYSIGRLIGENYAKHLILPRISGRKVTLESLKEYFSFSISFTTGGFAEGEVEKIDLEKNTAIVKVKNSPYCRLPDGKVIERKSPSCYLLAGILAGALSLILGKVFKVKETKCMSEGNEYCEFLIEPA